MVQEVYEGEGQTISELQLLNAHSTDAILICTLSFTGTEVIYIPHWTKQGWPSNILFLTLYFHTFSHIDFPKGQVSYCHHWASVVCPSVNFSHFNQLLWSHWANLNQTLVECPWMAPFQNCVRWSRLPTKMATKLKIKKKEDEILIVQCCFSISHNELKFKLQLHGKE